MNKLRSGDVGLFDRFLQVAVFVLVACIVYEAVEIIVGLVRLAHL
jgi:hypothetical protein